ncbi:metallophosphoesterase [Myxococcus sp. K15C18031901]|uniref:metallophosphoesterase n=1 Tax=Myxococcus dinghuensis TaxID=2906761 RepID=UPI0020A83810|nr:metallophosphoesterase [Myxococcus dinghuensis]MCP3100791.1 metallophosphoesterase [Myxococcus dinghuensis]
MSKLSEAWTSLSGFLLLGVGWLAFEHYYLWARLVRDVGLPKPATWTLTLSLGVLAVSIPLGVFVSRLVPPAWSVWWLTPVYVWIGVSTLLLMSVVVVDVLRVGALLASGGSPPMEADRREALARLGALAAVTVGLVASGWGLREGRRVRVKRVEVPLKKLPPELDGLSIVQLSDMHIGPMIGRDFVEHVVKTVNALAPDVVAITGDLVDGSVEDLALQVAPLANLTSTHGSYFVTGNHEYHADASRWCEHLGQLGVRVLRNEYVEVGRGEHVLHLAGIDDYESTRFDIGHRVDLPGAVAGRDTRRALVLLAHQPKAIHEAVQHEVDLQLSGHTHGGQIWPLGWLLRLGQPVVAGLARFGATWVYVSSGTGFSGPPMRLGSPAEITHLILRAA